MADSLKILADPGVFPWIAFVFGLAAGSFLNVVIHRLPKMMDREWLENVPQILEESKEFGDPEEAKRLALNIREQIKRFGNERLDLIVPRSRCPACGHRIHALENVPVLSFLILRGKCSACGARISARYPAVELLAGIVTGYAAWRLGFGVTAFAAMFFLWCLIALTFIDIDHTNLPDDITLLLLWAGLLLNMRPTFAPSLESAIIGAAAGYLSLWSLYWAYKLVRHKEGMGYGDFKLLAAIGAWFGWKALFPVILLSSIVGATVGIALIVASRMGWEKQIPFGPYLAGAAVMQLFWGRELCAAFPAACF
jgi:leader peptidase (prepilin peptidase) / N-methyltransferase